MQMMKKIFSEEDYQALTSSLLSRFPSFQTQGKEAYNPGLERSMEIDARMGLPSKDFPCIHVAGTNGKGSVSNMLAAHYAACGLKVGLYTSPHILDFRERMRVVTGKKASLITKEKLWDLMQEYGKDFDELGLSFFELTTALAFRFFADEQVDMAIIETGLGGRLDATNIIEPILSVITNIGLDHTNLLGDTLEAIAGEKAGIIKPGVPVVVGESNAATNPVFEKVADANGSRLWFADKMGFAYGGGLEVVMALNSNSLGISDEGFEKLLGEMDLQGEYQARNLRTVLAALRVLEQTPRLDALAHAAEICDFHGRWEQLAKHPFTICDIGHNGHGLKYNFAQLDKMMDSGAYDELVMVYGSVADKDVDAALKLIPERAKLVFTSADSQRAMPAEEIMRRFEALHDCAGREIHCCPKVADAMALAMEMCTSADNPLLYIGGSTYVVAEAIPEFKKLYYICLDRKKTRHMDYSKVKKAHPWHGIDPGDPTTDKFKVFIEIVPTDQVKYELDKESGYLSLDRPQKFSNIVPSLYGFVPKSYCGDHMAHLSNLAIARTDVKGDGDPLDICVLTEKDVTHGDIIVHCKPIGGIRLLDHDQADDKIIAVLKADAVYSQYNELEELPQDITRRLVHYFTTYKDIPGDSKQRIRFMGLYGAEEAHRVIEASLEDYQEYIKK